MLQLQERSCRSPEANALGHRSCREVALLKEHVAGGRLGYRSQSFLAHGCAHRMALFSPVISSLLSYIPLEHLSSHPVDD